MATTNMEGAVVAKPGPYKPPGVPVSQADPWMFPIPGLVTQGGNPIISPPSSTPAPPTNPAPKAPTITLPGQDWHNLLFGDAGYISGHAGIEAQKAAALANLQGMARAALVRLGYVPPGLQDKYGVIDQATIDAANQNPNSVKNQLERLYQQNITTRSNQDEARGIFHEAGAQQQAVANEGVAAGARTQDAIDSFLQAIQGYNTNYASSLGQAQTQEGQLINDVGTKLSQDPTLQGTSFTATQDSSASSQYGQPLYRGPNGKLYTVNGDEFTPPAAAPRIDTAQGVPLYGWSGRGVGGI